jgi:Zn-dependent protease with chaperone function
MAYVVWGWRQVMMCAGVIRPAPERLEAVVRRLSEETGIKPRVVEAIDLPVANALAFPFAGAVGFTDACLAVLSDEELAPVAAHELAHLAEPRRVRVLRLVPAVTIGVFATLPAACRPFAPLFRSDFGLFVPLGLYFLVLAGLVLYGRLYRRMEVRADEMARQFEDEPGRYARALEKLYAANLVPVVITTRKHRYPELYDRMVAAGVTPDYPRPAPPPRWRLYVGLLGLVAGTIAGAFVLAVIAVLLAPLR